MPAHRIVYLLGRERPTNDPFVSYIAPYPFAELSEETINCRETHKGAVTLRVGATRSSSALTPGFSLSSMASPDVFSFGPTGADDAATEVAQGPLRALQYPGDVLAILLPI